MMPSFCSVVDIGTAVFVCTAWPRVRLWHLSGDTSVSDRGSFTVTF